MTSWRPCPTPGSDGHPVNGSGVGLVLGGGAGLILGLLLGGGAGLALGVSMGAGAGLVVGAAWDSTHANPRDPNLDLPPG